MAKNKSNIFNPVEDFDASSINSNDYENGPSEIIVDKSSSFKNPSALSMNLGMSVKQNSLKADLSQSIRQTSFNRQLVMR